MVQNNRYTGKDVMDGIYESFAKGVDPLTDPRVNFALDQYDPTPELLSTLDAIAARATEEELPAIRNLYLHALQSGPGIQAAPSSGAYAAALDQAMGKSGYAYEKSSDPGYEAYRRAYHGGAAAGLNNTLGALAARTGGQASSYATQAAEAAYYDQLRELLELLYLD